MSAERLSVTLDTLERESWDRGGTAYVDGLSLDLRYALIVWPEIQTVTVARVGSHTPGRWECTTDHHDTYRDVYASRFPVSLQDAMEVAA